MLKPLLLRETAGDSCMEAINSSKAIQKSAAI